MQKPKLFAWGMACPFCTSTHLYSEESNNDFSCTGFWLDYSVLVHQSEVLNFHSFQVIFEFFSIVLIYPSKSCSSSIELLWLTQSNMLHQRNSSKENIVKKYILQFWSNGVDSSMGVYWNMNAEPAPDHLKIPARMSVN